MHSIFFFILFIYFCNHLIKLLFEHTKVLDQANMNMLNCTTASTLTRKINTKGNNSGDAAAIFVIKQFKTTIKRHFSLIL